MTRTRGARARALSCVLGALCALVISSGAAQAGEARAGAANSALLIAKPDLIDPNFRETVVLVTQADDASTVGVILNRPSKAELSQLLPDEPASRNYADAVFLGGPVMRRAIIAVFTAEAPPQEHAFHVLPGVYMTMHAGLIRRLLTEGRPRYRLYAGFAGWAPGQLQGELERDGWFVLPAGENHVFRKDVGDLWRELLEQAQGRQTRSHIEPAQPWRSASRR